jgi:predicted CoA-substrate-specific enzyme activase
VLLDGESTVVSAAVEQSGIDADETARSALQDLLAAQSLTEADLASIVATGYGRGNVDFADKNVTEITCHARGVAELFPQARGVIDIGGQDSKVIELDSGQVIDFAMNDKCAAGTGKYLESMAETLEIELSEMGALERGAEEATPLSSTCAVFAESEVISQIHQGAKRPALVAGICESVVDQIMGQVERVGLEPPIAMTGGVARNEGVRRRLEAALETDLLVPEDPQIVGAHGAALIGH